MSGDAAPVSEPAAGPPGRPGPPSPSRWRERLLFALALAVHLAVLYAPDAPSGIDAVAAVPGLDKAVHLLVFAAVALTGRRAGLPVRWLAAGLVANAVASEAAQHALLAERAGDPLDVLADLAGTLLGLAAGRPRRRTPSSPRSRWWTMAT